MRSYSRSYRKRPDRSALSVSNISNICSDNMTAVGEFTPILKAYIACDYKKNQIIHPDILSLDPIWEGDFSTLGSATTVVIKRTVQGEYVASTVVGTFNDEDDQDGLVPEVALWKDIDVTNSWGEKVSCLSFVT